MAATAEENGITELIPRAGDALPSPVAELLHAFAAGEPEAARRCFSANAIWAPPSDEANETAPRSVYEGEAIVGALEADPQMGRSHGVRLCLHEGTDCMLEGEILGEDGSPIGSYGAGFQLKGEKIDRAIVFRTPAVEDNAGTQGENVAGVDIQQQIEGYFHELESAQFETATAFFSAEGLYLHPPYFPGETPRPTFRGTVELLAGFEKRGAQDLLHFIDVSIQRGPFLMLEGHTLIDGTPEEPTGSYISSATVDGEGRILRYLAFYTMPTMVPRR